jgi:hypothetical protein
MQGAFRRIDYILTATEYLITFKLLNARANALLCKTRINTN